MLTELDQIANRNHLQLIKAILPWLPPEKQKTFSVLIKLMEVRNVLSFYGKPQGNLRACGASGKEPHDLVDILSNVREYCEGAEQEMIDQALQMVSMMELYSIFAQQENSQEGGESDE